MGNTCAHCGKPVNKKPDKRSKTGNIFCNSACAASYNNRIPKRKAKHHCKKCGATIWGGTLSGFCKKCYWRWYCLNDKTLCEVTNKRKDANRYTTIRQAARRTYFESDRPRKCLKCGYRLHVEICHVKGIADFSDDTKVGEVNDLKNLVAFCRKHHWEFDHDYLCVKAGKAIDTPKKKKALEDLGNR